MLYNKQFLDSVEGKYQNAECENKRYIIKKYSQFNRFIPIDHIVRYITLFDIKHMNVTSIRTKIDPFTTYWCTYIGDSIDRH